MVKLQIGDETIECKKAVKGENYIHIYNTDDNISLAFDYISDFSAYELLEGEWTYPEPTN